MVALAIAFALAGLGSVAAQSPPGTGATRETPAQPPAALSPQQRGDILMVRKMYREAIEAFAEGPQNDPVILNKTGIAYHQMQQLDRARKFYERACHRATTAPAESRPAPPPST